VSIATLSPAQLKTADRTLSAGTWTITAGAVLFSVLTVTPLVVGVTPAGWTWTSPILPIVVDAAVVIVIRMDATVAQLGARGGFWPGLLRWLTGLMTLGLNTGDSWLKHNLVGVAVHAVAPTLLIVTAETSLHYRRKIADALARIDREQAERERQRAAEKAERERLQREERERREAADRAERERLAEAERTAERERREADERKAEADRAERERLAEAERTAERERREADERKAEAERRHQAEETERQRQHEARLAREQADRDEARRQEERQREEARLAAEGAERKRQEDEERRRKEAERQRREQAQRDRERLEAEAAQRQREQRPPADRPVPPRPRPAVNTPESAPVNASKKVGEAEALAAVERVVNGEISQQEAARITGWSAGWINKRVNAATADPATPVRIAA
jgi:hypothetical protein